MPKIDQLFVAIRDDEMKVFNVIGPVSDDSSIVAKVQAEQQKGRKVRCETALYNSNQEMIEGGKMLGLKYDPNFQI